jgi:hypothetical protein
MSLTGTLAIGVVDDGISNGWGEVMPTGQFQEAKERNGQ